MSRERAVSAFIIKKQDYSEADQIITLFTKEEGKLRALVKAAKLPTSKLQPMLQQVFQTKVNLTGSNSGAGMPKIIGVQLIAAYSNILEDQDKLAAWYVASELVMRSLGDSAPNEPLFFELQSYAEFLNQPDWPAQKIKTSNIQFQIKAMNALGLGVRTDLNPDLPLFFSLDRGGFTNESSVDSIPVDEAIYESFSQLSKHNYNSAPDLNSEEYKTLSGFISRFVSYQLEREIKSQRLISS